jgi:hypothetical protein
MSGHRSGKRPWLAAALALLYPGLGHAYLREWLRALAWFTLAFATVALALPQSAVPETGAGFSLDAVMSASRALPIEASVAISVLLVLNTVDAYRLARRGTRTEATTAPEADGQYHCPNCGRETDADLDFCQWCTEPLDEG